jgi:hypothetical protein
LIALVVAGLFFLSHLIGLSRFIGLKSCQYAAPSSLQQKIMSLSFSAFSFYQLQMCLQWLVFLAAELAGLDKFVVC